MKQIKLSL